MLASARSFRFALALAVLAAPLPAQLITTNFTGKVVKIQGKKGNDVITPFAAHGVKVGTPCTVSIVIDSTKTGHDITGGFVQYDMAVADCSVTAGTWTAHFDPPPSLVTLNFVQVNNDLISGPVKADSWTATAIGTDTDAILATGATPPFAIFSFDFIDGKGKAASDDGLVQDLFKYVTEHLVSVAGPPGSIVFDLDVKGGGGPTTDPTALARQGELKAAAKLSQKLMKGLGKLVAQPPGADPQGAEKDALLTASQDDFGTAFLAAVNNALKKGGSAPLDGADKDAATTYLMKGLTAQNGPLEDWADLNDPASRVLASKLDKALASALHAEFMAQAADAKKPNADKLAAALDKAHAALEKQVGKALDKAGAQGVSYSGPDEGTVSANADAFVDGFVLLTKNGAP